MLLLQPHQMSRIMEFGANWIPVGRVNACRNDFEIVSLGFQWKPYIFFFPSTSETTEIFLYFVQRKKGANNIFTVRIKNRIKNMLFKMWRWIWTVEPWNCPGWRLPSEVMASCSTVERDYMPSNGNLPLGVRADCSTVWWFVGSMRSCSGLWHMEWSQVLYSSDCCIYVAGGVSARLYTIRYIMTRRALLHLTSSGVQCSFFIIAVTLLVRR
jgi:hypothetical protein